MVISSTRIVCLVAALAVVGCGGGYYSRIDDEALQRGHKAADYLPKKIDNYFKGMDGVIVPPPNMAYQLLDKAPALATSHTPLADPVATESEMFGRNTWMIWVGGNDGFWDWLSVTYGFIDLLKLVETPREQRFIVGGKPESAGMINEPGMMRSGPDEFGLLLDKPVKPEIAKWRRDYIRRVFHLDTTCTAAPPKGQTAGGAYGGGGYGGGSTYGSGYGAAYDGMSDELRAEIPPPEIYGLSSGVVGLRLFPNPNFDADACKKWNARKYNDDPLGDPSMVRPYRVGMACAFCHASWHPLNPPSDMLNPRWENISGNIGAQYLRPRAAFGNILQKDNFVYHVLDSQPPGTIDTSLVASDNINNPNTMNSVFNIPERVAMSLRNVREKQGPGSTAWPSLWQHPEQTKPDGGPFDPVTDALPQSIADLFDKAGLGNEVRNARPGEGNRRTPRILLDGADSIGGWGALARVYLNIGTNWEQWNTLHAPVAGFRQQKPFSIANVERHSVYFQATKLRVPALRDYFLKVTPPMPLLATPGSDQLANPDRVRSASVAERRHLVDVSKLAQGRQAFAHNCITCHSSIQPQKRQDSLANAPNGEFWDHDPGKWLDDPEYRTWAEKAVEDPVFWRSNYLSTDYRVAVNYVNTNSCRAMATNAMNGHMWEDFASDSYRSMPSIGPIEFFNPYKQGGPGMDSYRPAHKVDGAPAGGGGPGFYRVPTLVSIWATAPYFHNNALGLFNSDPSVNGRLDAFDDGIRKLLWKQKRYESSSYNEATPERLKADQGLIWRTPNDTYLVMPGGYVARALGSWLPALGEFEYRYPWLLRVPPLWRPVPSLVLLLVATIVLVRTYRLRLARVIGYGLIVAALVVGSAIYFFSAGFGGLRIGPFPKGVPVNLLANMNPDAAGTMELLKVARQARSAFTEIASTKPDAKKTDQLLAEKVAPALVKVSKCPDFVMDKGHYFPWFEREQYGMTDADKDALIELLKTF